MPTQRLGDVWQRYYDLTSKASDAVRTLAIAGLAAVWLFSGSQKDGLVRLSAAPKLLLVAGALFASALALDLAHYFVSSITQRHWLMTTEDERDMDAQVEVPKNLSLVPRWFYYAKVVVLAAGFAVLAVKMVDAAL